MVEVRYDLVRDRAKSQAARRPPPAEDDLYIRAVRYGGLSNRIPGFAVTTWLQQPPTTSLTIVLLAGSLTRGRPSET
jgi:hypothetical protein